MYKINIIFEIGNHIFFLEKVVCVKKIYEKVLKLLLTTFNQRILCH